MNDADGVPIRVAVIDDNRAIRTSLTRLLKAAGLEVASYASAMEFLAAPDHDLADCVVADIRMPEVDGLALQEKLRDVAPHQAIVFLTGHGDVSTSVRAMKAGAVDFLQKPADGEVLLESIQRAVDRGRRARADRAEVARLERHYASLTRREREVFALVTSGMLNKQVGAKLGTTEKTVKVQRARVMEKMDAGSLADLVRMAQRLNLEAPEQGLGSADQYTPSR